MLFLHLFFNGECDQMQLLQKELLNSPAAAKNFRTAFEENLSRTT